MTWWKLLILSLNSGEKITNCLLYTSYYHRLKIVEEFEKKEKPVFILGANFGPYITQDFFDKYFFLFSKCHDICFRDSYSKELFKNLDNVRYCLLYTSRCV